MGQGRKERKKHAAVSQQRQTQTHQIFLAFKHPRTSSTSLTLPTKALFVLCLHMC